MEPITYAGIDAHKAGAASRAVGAVLDRARDWGNAKRGPRKLERIAPDPIACRYEAGSCGYALQRQLDLSRS